MDNLDDVRDLDDDRALGDQLLSSVEFANDLLGRVPGAFHGQAPGQTWPAEESHSPWTNFQGPHHAF